MDPGPHYVAEGHAGLVEKRLGDAEHVVCFVIRVATRAVDVPGVQVDLAAQANDRPARSRCAGLARARAGPPHLVRPVRLPGPGEQGERCELDVGIRVERWLPDEGRCRADVEHASSERTDARGLYTPPD